MPKSVTGLPGPTVPKQVGFRLAAVETAVDVAARPGFRIAVLGHERKGRIVQSCDLFCPVLIDHVTVGHFEGLGIVKPDLVLAVAALALATLNGHAGAQHAVAYRANQRFIKRGSQDVVIDPIG